MTTILLNRRSLLAGGGYVMATGGSTLIAPAHAAGLEPTLSMAGGSNNYLPGAPVVDRIGKGGILDDGHCTPRGRRGAARGSTHPNLGPHD